MLVNEWGAPRLSTQAQLRSDVRRSFSARAQAERLRTEVAFLRCVVACAPDAQSAAPFARIAAELHERATLAERVAHAFNRA